MPTDVLVENDFKKNEKNLICETLVWPLAGRVKNLIEKKWPGLSHSGMTSGGLRIGNWPLIKSTQPSTIIFTNFAFSIFFF